MHHIQVLEIIYKIKQLKKNKNECNNIKNKFKNKEYFKII